MSDAGQDAINKIYEDYVTQGTTNVNTLKEDMLVNSQEVSQAILNISKMSTMFDINYTSGGNISVPPGHTIIYPGSASGNWALEGNYYPPIVQKSVDTGALAERIITQYVPGNPLVICLDNDLTSEQVNEVTGQLIRHNIEAVIIRGARAGTGRPQGDMHYTNVPDQGKRIDILARLAETWERHPDLTFAELIRWWNGENMADDDFAAATDVYAKKVYELNGIHPAEE